MNTYKLLIGLGLPVAVLLVVLTLKPSKPVTAEAEGQPVAVVSAQRRPAGAVSRPRAAQPAARKTRPTAKGAPALEKASEATEPQQTATGTAATSTAEARAAAEKAVEAWEGLVDQLAELKDVPTRERMASVKAAFDKLDKGDQTDAIHTALNLLPDEQFTALYAILFDKSESEEVLDAIFSDALNRSEDIKVPLMKELAKDKTHPMYFESARILDATGELENMAGAAENGSKAAASGNGQAQP